MVSLFDEALDLAENLMPDTVGIVQYPLHIVERYVPYIDELSDMIQRNMRRIFQQSERDAAVRLAAVKFTGGGDFLKHRE